MTAGLPRINKYSVDRRNGVWSVKKNDNSLSFFGEANRASSEKLTTGLRNRLIVYNRLRRLKRSVLFYYSCFKKRLVCSSLIVGLSTFFIWGQLLAEVSEPIIFANEGLKISGNSSVIGNIHSNGELEISDNLRIFGDISSAEEGTSFHFPNQEEILEKLKNYIKIEKNLKLKGKDEFSGIFFVVGDVRISGDVKGELTVIATGDIEVTGNVELRSIEDDIVLYTEKGEIKISGNTKIKGRIIGNQIKIYGNPAIGPLMEKYFSGVLSPADETKNFFKNLGIMVENVPAETSGEVLQEEAVEPPVRGLENLSQDQGALNLDIKDPFEFSRKYELKENAEITLTVVDENMIPVCTQDIPSGEIGSRKGSNEVILWDGRDMNGEESPKGNYTAFLAIHYPDGTEELKVFQLVK